ncbi:MAG: preprotein translocase subunit SecE [Pseudomonadota bacterium]
MTMVNPLQFIQQVRAEVAKVVWPTRREVALTSVMVFFLAVLTAAFFWLIDRVIFSGLEIVLTYFGT